VTAHERPLEVESSARSCKIRQKRARKFNIVLVVLVLVELVLVVLVLVVLVHALSLTVA
jgi:hypothetical protein